MILAGDIGGTYTRLAIFEHGKKIAEHKYHSREFQDLDTIVLEFLKTENKTVAKACFGVPGLVQKGFCKTTNLPWVIDAKAMEKKLNISAVALLNDLEASAYGLRALQKEDLFILQKGDPSLQGNQALLAAGTGLGEAGLFWDGKTHHPFATEGGHVDFAPRNEEDVELLRHLQKRLKHVSSERLISAPGLCLIYQFLVETGRAKRSSQVEEKMEKLDPAKAIVECAAKGQDPTSALVLEWFLALFGAEAGNVALKFLSLGGVYLGGGIVPHVIKNLVDGPFLSAFSDKGRFGDLLSSIPIYVVLSGSPVILGAAQKAEQM